MTVCYVYFVSVILFYLFCLVCISCHCVKIIQLEYWRKEPEKAPNLDSLDSHSRYVNFSKTFIIPSAFYLCSVVFSFCVQIVKYLHMVFKILQYVISTIDVSSYAILDTTYLYIYIVESICRFQDEKTFDTSGT